MGGLVDAQKKIPGFATRGEMLRENAGEVWGYVYPAQCRPTRLMPMSLAVRALICVGASSPCFVFEQNRRWAEPKMVLVKLVWFCLVIVLGFLVQEPSC